MVLAPVGFCHVAISDLAVVWWKEYKYPVRAALTIAMLYRNLAQTPDTIPHVR